MDKVHLAVFARDLRRAQSRDQAFAALQALSQATIGVRLFTVMTIDMEAMLARRAFTSHPREYPTSGTKPVEMNDWFAQVCTRRETFVANSLEAIAEVFPDHALIGSLGCGAVINVPVVQGEAVVATINLLDRAGRYTPQVAARATDLLEGPARQVML